MNTKNRTICYVAGKTGGHIIPCVTHGQQLKDQSEADKIVFFTTNSPLDTQILKQFPIVNNQITIPFANLPGKNIWRYPYFFYCMIAATMKSFVHLVSIRPSVVISMGGLVSIPVCVSAWLLRIPIDLYELNVEPGKAIMMLAPWARRMYICFSETQKYFPKITCHKASYPVRYADKVKNVTQEHARKMLQLDSSRHTILILGGSQGSLFLNSLIKRLVEQYPEFTKRIQVIHQTGALDAIDWYKVYREFTIPAIVFPFTDDLVNYYAAADLVICRSGAGTMAETLFFKKRCVTIPLQTHATSHQLLNARAYAQEYPELVNVVMQNELSESVEKVYNILTNSLPIFFNSDEVVG